MAGIHEQGAQALEELGAVLARLDAGAAETAVAEVAKAKRLALYGVGREGLMMKAFAMRLYHLGLDAHVVGDMSTPPLGQRDLLLVSAGPGHFSTVAALLEVASAAGARTLCVTAQPDGSVPQAADNVLLLPAQTMAAQTMADDRKADQAASLLPMGSLYEGAQYLVFEILVLALRARLGESPESLRQRHTNLE